MKNQHVELVSRSREPSVSTSVRYRAFPTRDWTINVRLLFWTAAVLVVVAPAVYGLRTFNVRRNAVALFERAEALEQQGELSAAANNLFRYLKFQPDDGSARVLLAQVYDKTAVTQDAKVRATEHYYTALTHFPERNDLRTRLAEILLEIDRPSEAADEALRVLIASRDLPRTEVLERLKQFQDRFEGANLVAINASAPAALRVLATASFENSFARHDRPASELLLITQSALAVNPNDIELSLLLTRVYREFMVELTPAERATQADEVVHQMATRHPDTGQANLALYRYRKEHGLPAADQALSIALKAAPNNYEVVLAAAADALSADSLDNAESYFAKAISLPDADPRAYTGLAQLRLRQGRADDSIAACEKGLSKFGPDEVALQLVRLQAAIHAQQLTQAEELLSKVIRPLQERFAPLLRLSDRTRLRDQISMLEVDLAVAQRKLLHAAAILRNLTVPRSGERRLDVDLLERARRWRRLAQVYEELRYWELAAKAYEQEAALQEKDYLAHRAAGVAWRAGGRLESAIHSFENALSAPDAQAEGWLLLSRAELERQMRRTERDWAQIDQPLRKAEQLLGAVPAVEVLKIEVLRAKGDDAAALAALAEKAASNPKEILPFAVLFYQQIGQADQANQSLAELANITSIDDRTVRLLEVELRRRQKKYDECEQILHDLLSTAQAPDRYSLMRQLAAIGIERGSQNGGEQLHELLKEYPADPWAVEQLAELAFSQHDYERLADYERLLEQLEGGDGTYWRFYRGMRLVAQVPNVEDPRFQQAVRLHSELQSLRPAWPRTLQFKGRLAQQMGKVEEAAEAYKSAIEAGATSVTVFEGLVTLLYANNRWSEADAFLERLQNVGYESPVLDSLSARVLLRQGEFQQAVSAARSGATLRPRDPLAHIWLGQTLTIAASREQDADSRQALLAEAESSFENAVTIAPEDFRTWSGLLWYCVRAMDKEAGQRALEGLRSKARLTDTQRMLAMGQAHQLLGEYAHAEEAFLGAVKLLPNDAATQERLAQFYLTYSPEKAHHALRRLLALDPKSTTARRSLAILMVSQGGDTELAEAIKLLRGSGEQSDSRRLEAVLLLQRGGKENLQAARKLFEALSRESTGDHATDRHLLAVIAEAQGDLPEARRLFEQLAEEKENAVQWASLAEFLLRNGLSSEATRPVAKLAETSPNSWQTLRIKTKWLKAMGQQEPEIEKEIDRYYSGALEAARSDTQKLAVINRLAGLLAELDLKAKAQLRYRAFFEEKPTDQVRQAFALWLIKNQQIADAVRLALEGLEGNSPTTANIQLLSNVLTIGTSQGLRFSDAEAALEAIMREQPENASLLLEFATLRHVQGDMQAATRLYRQAIAAVPGNANARNNLAVLLLEQPDGAREGLIQIEEALRMAGPIPELRDTYALALAHNGRAEEACSILRGLLSQSPHNARFLFHLAVAANKAGNNVAAADAFNKAIANKLEGELLTPTERRQILELQKALGVAVSASAQISR